ncbi:MAG: hypothetical protein HY738_09125 [Bacteroidia bacterium]|nr:hypothetical protein [Bacteroidia bacterium]
MKLLLKISLIISICLIIIIFRVSSTLIFSYSEGINTFVCVNEDGTEQDANVWFSPGINGGYGRISFGWNDGISLSGINEKGLFIGLTKIPKATIRFTSEKLTLSNEKVRGYCQIAEKIMETCSTVEESIALINKYNVEEFMNYHLLLADRSGASAILEWGDTSLVIMEKEGNYQLMTNFSIINPSKGNYPCEYYKIAENILKTSSINGKELCKSALEASVNTKHNVFSLIYDLNNFKIYVYYQHIFTKVVEIDLKKEMNGGTRSEKISSLMQGGIPAYNELKKKDGKMYYLDEVIPYSGYCIDYYNNGQKKTERYFIDGIENGTRINFYENGNKEIREDIANGEKNGKYISYTKQGIKKEDGEYRNSRPEGKWTGWYDEAHKEYEKHYIDGKLDGTWTGWRENGIKEYEKNFKDGKPEGLVINYYENGSKESEKSYIGGKENGLCVDYYENGLKKYEKNYKDGKLQGTCTKYYDNGQKKEEEYYENDISVGNWVGWHINGVKEYELPYEGGLKHGKYNSWHDNAQKRAEGEYKNGKKEGQWNWYYSSGITDIIGTYNNGKETGLWTGKYENNKMKFERYYNFGVPQGKWTSWYENSNKKFKGEYNAEGERTGKWIYWLENGDVIREEEYEEGMLNKTIYYKDGKAYEPKKGEKMEGFFVEGEPVR